MPTEQEKSAAQALTDMLAVAKLWMPELMFEIDPRVHAARQLVATVNEVSGSRAPSIVRDLADDLPAIDLAPPATLEQVDQMSGAEPPPWDITAGLDAFMASDLATPTRTEAVIYILRDWLIGHGYLAATPDPEEAN
ncbi:MAG: hypothetical protein ACTHLT_00580 [Devosia sp.]